MDRVSGFVRSDRITRLSAFTSIVPSSVFGWCYGPEFAAKDLRQWLADTGARTLYIEPRSPSEISYCESFNSKQRDEFLNGEIFYSLKEMKVLVERWMVHYNTVRPHSSLGYRPPAPAAWHAENKTGHGKMEGKKRLPLFHTHICSCGFTHKVKLTVYAFQVHTRLLPP